VACKTEVNIERARLGVHASNEHDVVDFFLVFEVVSVVHKLVVNDLADKADRGLGSVLVDFGHVKIVHEEHQNLAAWGTIDLTGSLVDV